MRGGGIPRCPSGRRRGGGLVAGLSSWSTCAAGFGRWLRGGGWGAFSGQRSGAGARGCSTPASRPLRLGARRLMSPPPRLSGRAHRRLPPLAAAAGAFSTRGRRGGGGPGAGPGPSRHNEDAGPGGSPLGARPDGRSTGLGAPRPHQRRPSLARRLARPRRRRPLLPQGFGVQPDAQTSGPAAPKEQQPRGKRALDAVGALRLGARAGAKTQRRKGRRLGGPDGSKDARPPPPSARRSLHGLVRALAPALGAEKGADPAQPPGRLHCSGVRSYPPGVSAQGRAISQTSSIRRLASSK